MEAIGTLAIAQTITQYVITGTDLGLRSIGARLIAKDHNVAPFVIKYVEKRRGILNLICVMFGGGYVLFSNLSENTKIFTFFYLLTSLPYFLFIDWVFWGLEKFILLGLWRACVSLISCVGGICIIMLTHKSLFSLVWSNLISIISGSAILFYFWMKNSHVFEKKNNIDEIRKELNLRSAVFLGIAIFFNQTFQSFDVLLLGGMSNTHEVGIYNAAYKILFLVFGGYYLLTQGLFPEIAKRSESSVLIKSLLKYGAISFLFGVIVAVIIAFFSTQIISLIYGVKFLAAQRVLNILLLALPMEFFVALMGTALTGMGYNKILFFVTVLGAAINIILNIFLIPRFMSIGSAWATVLSYLILTFVILIFFIRKMLTNIKLERSVVNEFCKV